MYNKQQLGLSYVWDQEYDPKNFGRRHSKISHRVYHICETEVNDCPQLPQSGTFIFVLDYDYIARVTWTSVLLITELYLFPKPPHKFGLLGSQCLKRALTLYGTWFDPRYSWYMAPQCSVACDCIVATVNEKWQQRWRHDVNADVNQTERPYRDGVTDVRQNCNAAASFASNLACIVLHVIDWSHGWRRRMPDRHLHDFPRVPLTASSADRLSSSP